MTQDFNDLWNRYMGRDVTPEAYAAEGWDMARILRDLRELWGNHPTDRLDPAELLDIANDIAAGLEERGLGPTAPAEDLESITLTVAHAASSYGRPVLVIDGQAYGPADMTPAGLTGAELVATWTERFYGPAWGSYLRRRSGETTPDRAEAPAIIRDLWDNTRTDWSGNGVIHLSPAMTDRLRAAALAGQGQPRNLADLAPEMLAMLRQMLELYDGRRLAPPENFASYWRDVRELIRQAEGQP